MKTAFLVACCFVAAIANAKDWLEIESTKTNGVYAVTLWEGETSWPHILDCPLGREFSRREIAKLYPDLPTNAHGVVGLVVPQTITACTPQQWQRAEVMRLDLNRGVFCGFLSRSPFFTTQEDVHKYLKERVEVDLKSKVKNWTCEAIPDEKKLRLKFHFNGSDRILDLKPVRTATNRYHCAFSYHEAGTE